MKIVIDYFLADKTRCRSHGFSQVGTGQGKCQFAKTVRGLREKQRAQQESFQKTNIAD